MRYLGTHMRALVGVVLVMGLVLTGHSVAVARGLSGSVGFMELCTGTGPVMVAVDADGVPVGPTHICPDYGLALLDWVDETPHQYAPLQTSRDVTVAFTAILATPTHRVRATARAPPVIL